jgi:hypothetical protein
MKLYIISNARYTAKTVAEHSESNDNSSTSETNRYVSVKHNIRTLYSEITACFGLFRPKHVVISE